MSSILSGGTGRAYGFDIENIVKCTSMITSSITSHSSSPSSTLSESSNSPHRKPRTPRKRPNQTYNEAAFLLSIACPKVFSTKTNNTNLSKLTRQSNSRSSFHKPPELLLPVIENTGFLLNQPIMKEPNTLFESSTPTSSCRTCRSPEEVEYPNWNSGSTSLEKPNLVFDSRTLASSCETCQSPEEVEYGNWNSSSTSLGLCDGFEDNFDTESMLDEEIEEGIDSIMGSSNSIKSTHESNTNSTLNSNTCYGYPMGLGFGGNLEFNFGFGMRNGVRALKNGDDGNWWSFPTVNVVNVSPPAVTPVKVKKIPAEKKKMKVEDLMKRPDTELVENCGGDIGSKLLLKLNYDDVLNAWSDKGSPLPEEISGSESANGDIHTRLAQIDLFSENGGLREASVMRYKEKKRTRLFSKKIRYQVRKVNADRRPRSKGRFVRRPNSEDT